MRIGIISDIHLESREHGYGETPAGKEHVYGGFSIEKQNLDLLIVAGDTHPYPHIRVRAFNRLSEIMSCPVIAADGNHDFYHGNWPSDDPGMIHRIGNLKIAVASLWTWLEPQDGLLKHLISDFSYIQGINVQKWNDLHLRHLDVLKNAKADVVVTHHAPFSLSTAEQYKGDKMNPFFINTRIDPAHFGSTKLWVHGHVHQPFDYMLDNIRVVCNPLGYPHETSQQYVVKVVEL